jgi:deoxyribodipyrimidine photo-lyase
MTTAPPTVVWFRNDLRLADNPALAAAAKLGPVVPVYILDDTAPPRPLGSAARWWLEGSLRSLGRDLAARGAPLILRRGPAEAVLKSVIAETGARRAHWNRLYDAGSIARDAALKSGLRERGLQVQSFNAALLNEPWTVKTGAGGAYRVFTPYWRAARALADDAVPCPDLGALSAVPGAPGSESLDAWGLRPRDPDWATGFSEWRPGEAGARARLEAFLAGPAADYAEARNVPGRPATSKLSPHLHFGEIGPRQVWAAGVAAKTAGAAAAGIDGFLRELGWREFNHHLLFHFPNMERDGFNPKFSGFPWRHDTAGLRAWRRGRTGYPIVDAGLRELWATGWMHNRVRMIAASFLVKDLMVDWRVGDAWFWDTLLDADLANNVAGWQWVAGCGADAAPYFRVFNPVLQGEKFDPEGHYVRRWVPELARLPGSCIHRPWTLDRCRLAAAGVQLGVTYPHPIIDHARARDRALAAYESL